MIVCNRCGAANNDEELLCQACGRKLQSGLSGPNQGGDGFSGPLEPLETPPPSLDLRRFLKKGLEAWAYALCLAGAGAYAAATGRWLLLLPAVGLMALLAWTRRV
jgi:hypothetical protein